MNIQEQKPEERGFALLTGAGSTALRYGIVDLDGAYDITWEYWNSDDERQSEVIANTFSLQAAVDRVKRLVSDAIQDMSMSVFTENFDTDTPVSSANAPAVDPVAQLNEVWGKDGDDLGWMGK